MADRDKYLRAHPVFVKLAGHPMFVWVHFGFVHGRVACVGLDLRAASVSLPGTTTDDGTLGDKAMGLPLLPVGQELTEITSPIVRSLPTARVIEQALESLRQVEDWDFGVGELDDNDAPLRADLQAVVDAWTKPPGTKKRGPKPLLDEEALQRVVAPAYRAAVRKPVQAVQAALLHSGLLGAHVTIDQARKAVAAARSRGFIPPAQRPTRQSEDQP